VADVDKDLALARHVTSVHQNEGVSTKKDDTSGIVSVVSEEDTDDLDEGEKVSEVPQHPSVTSTILREYISRARQHHPVVPPEVAPYIVEAYVSLRMQDRPGAKAKKDGDQTVMTARQLLSILRLGQALARLRFSDLVAREDVDEAIRLTHMSKASLLDEEDGSGENGKKRGRGEDVMSRIFNIMREYSTSSRSSQVEMKLCEAMVLRKGFTVQQLHSCLEEYEALDVIQVNSTRTHVSFIHG
jgi:DNA replication licensing factor MCM7